MPSGKVFLFVSNKTDIIDPSNDQVTSLPDMPNMDHSPWIYPHTPTAVILPMTVENKWAFTIQVCGGTKLSSKDASPMCWKISPDEPNASWTKSSDMPNARLMPDTVLLPDGTLLYVNGLGWGLAGGNAGQVQYARDPVYATDLYDPSKNEWKTLAPAKEKRLYHSGALLLSTGHVVTVGSEMDNYDDYWGGNEGIANTCMPKVPKACKNPFNTNIEMFTPPYIEKAKQKGRPRITKCNTESTHDSLVAIEVSTGAFNAKRVTMVRMSSVTHSTNTDQRFYELPIIARTETTIYVKTPQTPNKAPPGNWYVFVLDADNVPSVGATMKLTLGPSTAIPIPPDAVRNVAKRLGISLFLLLLPIVA
jgi:hypothetical protein